MRRLPPSKAAVAPRVWLRLAAATGLALGLCGIAGCPSGGPDPSPNPAADNALAVQSRADRIHSVVNPAILVGAGDAPALIQQVGDRLVDATRKGVPAGALTGLSAGSIRFDLVVSPVIDVCSAGGNHIYVSNDLFQRSMTEEELAAALAHALGHVHLRHFARREVPRSEQPLVLAYKLSGAPFTLEEEQAADEVGFALFVRAGYDPLRYGDVFQRLGHRRAGVVTVDARHWARKLPAEAVSWRTRTVADERTFAATQQQVRPVAVDLKSPQSMVLGALSVCFGHGAREHAEARAQLERLQPVETPGTPVNSGPMPWKH